VELPEVGHRGALRMEEGQGWVGGEERRNRRGGREKMGSGGGGRRASLCGQWRHCHPLLFSGNCSGFLAVKVVICVCVCHCHGFLASDKVFPHLSG
jgi:hypothetical protein